MAKKNTFNFKKERDKWKSYPDGKVKRKSVPGWKIFLFYGKNRGGVVYLVSKPSRSNKTMLSFHKEFGQTVVERAYMDWENAVQEYNWITSKKKADEILASEAGL